MPKEMIFMLGSVGLGFCAQMMLKLGLGQLGGLNFTQKGAGKDFLKLLTNPFLMGAIFLYFFSFLGYLRAMSGDNGLPLSVAYPMASLNMVLISIAARFFFQEKVGPKRWAGVGLVLVGVVLIGLSAPQKAKSKKVSMSSDVPVEITEN